MMDQVVSRRSDSVTGERRRVCELTDNLIRRTGSWIREHCCQHEYLAGQNKPFEDKLLFAD